ncbi:MAG: hypothetical protein HYW63_02350 [Candidatus Levybacteria bacterium]|nr:hypothetical protein [Candidatus Levybacteria bacterium]
MAPESRAELVPGTGQDGTQRPLRDGGVSHSLDGSPQSPHRTADLRGPSRSSYYGVEEALRADTLGRSPTVYFPD